MKKAIIILSLSSMLILPACSETQQAQNGRPSEQAVQTQLAQNESKNEQIAQSTTESQTKSEIADPNIPVLKDKDIYCNNQKVGKFENGRIYMKVYDQVVSVAQTALTSGSQGIDGLSCMYEYTYDDVPQTIYRGFSYNDLEISPKLYSPYRINQTIETPAENAKITYKCDGSLAKQMLERTKKYTENFPNFYCETNGKDYLTQYEFGAADGYPVLTTGAEVGESWEKIYIKKVAGLNYIFRGSVWRVGGNADDSNIWWSIDEPEDKYKRVTSKSNLDELIKDPEFTKSLALWQPIVDSFKVEKTDVLN